MHHRLYLFLLFFSMAGCQTYSAAQDPIDASAGVSLYVVSHGWHTGLIVDSGAALSAIPELEEPFQAARYIEFGWGDRDFYQAGDVSYVLAAKALFIPTEAVLHVVGIPTHPQVYFGNSELAGIKVSESGLYKMLAFIRRTFRRDRRGKFVLQGRGLYSDSFFYRAHGTYHAFYTCNSWIMEALTAAGLPEPGLPTLTAGGVMAQVERYRHSPRQKSTETTTNPIR